MAKNLNGAGVSTGLGKIGYSVLKAGVYQTPKIINDLVSFTTNQNESTVDVWAGNSQYLVSSSVAVEGSFVVPEVDNATYCELMGLSMSEDGGIIYDASAKRPEIALLIEQTNEGGVSDYITLFKVRLNLDNKSGSTKKDSVEFSTKEFSFKALMEARKPYMHVQSTDETDCPADLADTFFTSAPVLPTAKVTP